MRTTITINDTLFRSLKLHAAASDTSISRLVEEAIKHQLLEDFEDIDMAKQRQGEPELSFDGLVADLKAEGLL